MSKKTLDIEPYEAWDKEIVVRSKDDKFQFKVDYDDVDHEVVQKRMEELVYLYNRTMNYAKTEVK